MGRTGPATARSSPVEPGADLPAGATVRFEHLTIEDGLSQNAGLALLQDHTGYLWIGTQDGLNRYDGYSFKVYKHDPADPHSLSHNAILALHEDRAGQLWVGTWGGGLDRFDPATGQFTHFAPDPGQPDSLSHGIVTAILQDSTGVLWVGTLGGLDRLKPDGSGFEHFRQAAADPASLSADAVSTLFEDSRGTLWVGTGAYGLAGAGLNRFDRATGTFTHYQHVPADPHSLASDNVAEIAADPSGRLWVGTGGYSLPGAGLDLFDPATGTAQHFRHNPADPRSLSADNVFRVRVDGEGNLWLGTWGGGLNQMALSRPGVFTRYQPDPYLPHSLSSDSVWSLLPDQSGVLWVGTANNGLNKLTPHSRHFALFQNQPDDPASLGHNAVGAFAIDPGGALWVGTWGGGLDRFDPASGAFRHYRHDPTDPLSLSNDLVMALHLDAHGDLWIGTLGSGLDRLRAGSQQFEHFPPGAAGLADGNITAITSDADGLWLGTFAGLHRYTARTSTFTRYPHADADPTSLSHDQVVQVLLAPDNVLWLGTWGGGLNRLDLNDPASAEPRTARFTRYQHADTDPTSLSEDSVWAIQRGADGVLWLGTQGGLNRFDPAHGTFQAYGEKDGLRNATVLGVLGDAQGRLWLTTNNGLARFDPAAETFVIYDAADGLQSNEFNSNAWLRGPDGRLYVGGGHGFNIFDPAAIQPNLVPPPVVLTGLKVYNSAVPHAPGAPVELDHTQDFVAFEFAALDFHAPAKNTYAYKLEGVDPDWITAGDRRYASYTNLPGGQYTLRVRAANSDGVWNEAGLSLPVIVQPPFWEAWWFRGLGLAALAALGVAVFQARVYTIRAQNRQLEAAVQQRTAELRQANTQLATEVEQRKRAEAELARQAADERREAAARFHVMFENSAVGMGILSPERRLLQVNPAVCRMLGYSETELLGNTPGLIVHPDDRGLDADLFRELLAGQREAYAVERRYVRRDGSPFWGRLNYSLVRQPDGTPRYIFGTLEDIDDQKRALEELRESEERFRAAFDSSAIGITLNTLDGHLLRANAAVCRMSGYTEAELQQRTDADNAHPDDRAVGLDLLGELLAGRRDSYQVEKRYLRQTGEVFWTRVTLSAVRAPDGQPAYLVALVEDIDAQKRMLADLQASEARFRAVFESTSVGVALMGLDRRIFSVNAAGQRLIGYSEAELRQVVSSDLAEVEDRELGREQFEELVNGRREQYVVEKRYRRKDGTVFWGRVNFSAVRGAAGQVEYLVGLIEDISETRQAEERLAAQEAEYRRLLEQRIAERTEELNQANTLLQQKAAQEAVASERTRLARDLHDAVTQTLFAATLIAEVVPQVWTLNPAEGVRRLEELRQLTRGALAEMRTLLVELRPNALVEIPLGALLRQLTEAVAGRTRLKIQLSVEGDRALPPDVQVALYRIAQEALNNTVKHARASQAFVTARLGRTVRLTVADNGAGFAVAGVPADHLGLRIMGERAESVGAKFTVYSEPGEGTQVTVIWEATP